MTNNTPESDIDGQKRRRDSRKPVNWKAVITTETEDLPAMVSNVSLAGILVRCETILHKSQEIILTIEDLGEFAGEVVWVDSPFYGLSLMAGPDMDLKHFTVTAGEQLSQSIDLEAKDDWV